MIISNTLNVVELAVANIAANGPIGTAATTVDVASAFAIKQTAAGIAITVPSPTVATPAGQLIFVSNVGTAQFTIGGATVRPGNGTILQWSGAAWIPLADVANPTGLMYQEAAVAFVANTPKVITHNLNASVPARTQVQIVDADGNEVDVRRTAVTANTVTLLSPVALTNLSVVVIAS